MKRLLKRVLNHNDVLGWMIGWFYKYCSGLSPFRILFRDDAVVAFSHPTPSYREHVLVLPREIVREFLDLEDCEALGRILSSVHRLCGEVFPGEEKVLLVNGGVRQEIRQLHFHLLDKGESRVRGTKKTDGIPFGEGCLACLKSAITEGMGEYRGFTLVFDLTKGDTATIYFA